MTYVPGMETVPPLQWVGGHQAQHLLAVTGFEQMNLRERWQLIDQIDQKQDQYQRWLAHLPRHSPVREHVRTTLLQLSAKRLAIFLTIRPQYADKIHRASQLPTSFCHETDVPS